MLPERKEVNFDDLFTLIKEGGNNVFENALLKNEISEEEKNIEHKYISSKHAGKKSVEKYKIKEEALFKVPDIVFRRNLNREMFYIFDDENKIEKDGNRASFEKYYKFVSVLEKNWVLRKLYSITCGVKATVLLTMTSLSLILIFLLASYEGVATILALFLLHGVLSLGAMLILRTHMFDKIHINWISYMRYVFREKKKLPQKKIDDLTELLVYENNGIHSSFINDLMSNKKINSQINMCNWIGQSLN